MKNAGLNIYYSLMEMLPEKFRQKIRKGLYFSGLKPSVNTRKTNTVLSKGVVLLSADFELAWAYRYSRSKKNPVALGLKERQNIPEIVRLLDKYNLPVTWATVGHLFLKSCQYSKGVPHPEMQRPAYFSNKNWMFSEGDWYDHDPCTDMEKDPAWYGSDLLDVILSSKVKHEIACHSFSHIDFSDKNCTEELALSELRKCKELASEKNIQLKSMVFPGETYGNFEVLKNEGFICYRKQMKFELDFPYLDQFNLVALPNSLMLGELPFKCSDDFSLKVAKAYVKKAARYKNVAHLWFHPSMQSSYLEKVFPGVLHYISEMRDQGEIEVLTMKDLAERVIYNQAS